MNGKAKSGKESNLIEGVTGEWEVIVGLEVHAQVNSRSKLFSGSSTEFGAAPNSHVSLVDAAMPGMLPVINAECVAQAVRTGLGLNSEIHLRSVFDRKNYFYLNGSCQCVNPPILRTWPPRWNVNASQTFYWPTEELAHVQYREKEGRKRYVA